MTLEDSQANEAHIPSRAKEKGQGVYGFKGEEDNHKKMKRTDVW